MNIKIIKRILIISGIIEILIAVIYFIEVNFFPSEGCRLYGDCIGQGLTFMIVIFPISFMAIISFLVAFLKITWSKWPIFLLFWLILSWLYIGVAIVVPLYWTLVYKFVY